jgi:general secretion pathway protein G
MKVDRGRRCHAGFTIIELLIVVAIIGIIVVLVMPNLIGAIQRSRQSRTVADIRMISEGVEAYQNDHSFYPVVVGGTVAELGVDLEVYIRKFNDHDGWGVPIFYESDGLHYTVISFGWGGASTLPYTPGPTKTFDADIIFVDGAFMQWPEGPQRQ